MKRVVVLSTRLRPGSNSNTLAERVAEGAKVAGNEVEFISLRGKEIKFCIGCMSCQMKTLIGRMNAMYPKDYMFRDIYLLTTAAENEAYTPKRAESSLQGWIECHEKSTLKSHLFCGVVNDPKEICGNDKLEKAYGLGKRLVKSNTRLERVVTLEKSA